MRTSVQAAIRLGSLRFACEPAPADASIIAVPIPIGKDKNANMHAATFATESTTPHLLRGNLVIPESTPPLHTTGCLAQPILERSVLKARNDFRLAYSPDRVLPGRILHELVDNASCRRKLVATCTQRSRMMRARLPMPRQQKCQADAERVS
jgi:UDP-N-acetyl-D-mannosaminuronic acid dehydrogenase